MVGYRRNRVPGGTFFFTVVLEDRRSCLLVEKVAHLRHAFRATRAERPFKVDAIVILPDHLHAILTLPEGDSDFSGRWRKIKSMFSRQAVADGVPAKRNRKGEYSLWQRRFWEHTFRDDLDFARHFDYVHYNPVKHALVARASDWPYSSFHRYVRSGLLPEDWGGTRAEASGAFGERLDP
jgi:putative transposase